MKNLPKFKVIIFGAAFLLTTSLAIAQNHNHSHSKMGGGNCPMMDMMKGGEGHSYKAGRVAFLEAELGITDAQKNQFVAYSAALESNLQQMFSMRQSMMEMRGDATPTELLETHVTAMENRLAVLKKMKQPLKSLYEVLSEEQKTKADTLLTGMGCMK